jgi:hypothetical protein
MTEDSIRGPKSGLLDQMRHASESSGRNRTTRLNRQPATAVHAATRFEDLP